MRVINTIEMIESLVIVPVTLSLFYFLTVTGELGYFLLSGAIAIILNVIASGGERRWAQWRADVKAGRRDPSDLPK